MPTVDLLASYATLRYEIEGLKTRIDPILSLIAAEKEGLYTSRIKSPESIFDKLVLGNYPTPLTQMEDILAATIVLPNAPAGDELRQLEAELRERFDIVETRTNRTQRPAEFIYDDLHFILRLKDSPVLLNKRLLIWSFELQVKSYLQHGWSKATHNTIYKSGAETWRGSRVAAQTRALVEMIEAALAAGETLLPEAAERSYAPIDERVVVAGLISEWWLADLPQDRRRLSRFVLEFLRLAGLSVNDFRQLIESERGLELRNKSSIDVQQAILILLIESSGERLVKKLQDKGDRFILVTSEMEALSKACAQIPAEVKVSFSLTPSTV